MTADDTPRAPVEPLTLASREMLADARFHGAMCDRASYCSCGMTQNLTNVEREAADAARAERDRDAVAEPRRCTNCGAIPVWDDEYGWTHIFAAATPTEQPRDDGGLRARIEAAIEEWGELVETTSDGLELGRIPADGKRLEQAIRAALTDGAPDS